MKFEELLTAPAHEEGAEMEIMHPVSGQPTGAFLLIRGVDSKTFRDASLEFNRKRMEKGNENKDIALDLSVAITAGWRGIDDVEFSADAVRKLYQDSPAIRAQVDAFFTVRRNFMKG
jgi:hypothetical protein